MALLPEFLLRGYRNFRAGPYHMAKERYDQLHFGQSPLTMIIACSDSRAAPEIVFDAAPGELFVVRNVANLVPPYTQHPGFQGVSAALEYAVIELEVRHIVVMGHGRCGGINAALTRPDPLSKGDFIGKWVSMIYPIAEKCKNATNQNGVDAGTQLERASVVNSISNLRSYPWIKERSEKSKLQLHGAWFDISEGALWTWNEKRDKWLKEL